MLNKIGKAKILEMDYKFSISEKKKNRTFIMKNKIPGVTFSWKRALGITKAKQQIARKTGIPLSKQGLERKIGSIILKKLFG